jgi:hypothetical protein|tara:strand:+ start:2642 stop:3049 length:408 start_codon:yes stop_codon:yes gene_type:complete
MSDNCKQCLSPITSPVNFLLETKLALNTAKRALGEIEKAQSFEEKQRAGLAALSVIVTGLESVNANEQWESYVARTEALRKELEAEHAERDGATKVEVEEYDEDYAPKSSFDTAREAVEAVIGLTMDSLSSGGKS